MQLLHTVGQRRRPGLQDVGRLDFEQLRIEQIQALQGRLPKAS